MTTPPTPPIALRSPFAPPAPRSRPTRKVLVALAAVVVLVGGFAVHAAAGPSGPNGFRTATVGTSDVDQTLEAVGTVEPVTQAAVAFPVAGTVASVAVHVGDGVNVGETLATLDGASLQMAIDAQQAAVDQANLVLAKARAGDTSGSGGASTGGSGTAPGRTTASSIAAAAAPTASRGTSTGGEASSADPALARAQQDVVTGQQAVDAHLQTAQQALDTAGRICAAAGDATSTAPSPTLAPATTSTTVPGDEPDGPVSSDPDASGTSTASTTPDPSAIEACRDALQDVLDAQQQVADAQRALGTSAGSYDRLLDQRAADLATSASQGTGSTQASSAGSGGASQASAGVSSADLIKDQKAVDAAVAQLAVARQALQQATIVSPISGTVAAIGVAAGDAVTAGSTTATIVIVGEGGVEVTATVAVDRLPDVRLGQAATVRPDGGRAPVTGKVVAIGAPATSSTGATTYPVTIGLPSGTTGLRNGSVASVSIVTKAASHALVVPTSAVHTARTVHTVDVVDGSATKSVQVKVGAIGVTWTEVTSGLTAGQQVVLADLEAPLPTSATQVATNNRTRTGAGGAGAVRIPGGFGGGAFTGRRATGAG